MEFTGERYVPSVNGDIKYEHLHRYALCLDFVKGKSVLDIASGEGYGSALLATLADSVVGVDISAQSIEYAHQQYLNHQNLSFMVGSCDAIPLDTAVVDIVVSFETIEHHDRHEEMMLEIKRVLKPNGLLIISSPNRLTYSDEPNYSNPYHVKELYYDELVVLLNQHFKHVQIYGQKMAGASFVFPLSNSSATSLKSYTGDANNLTQQVCSLDSPIYYIAVCSDNEINLTSAIDSIYIEPHDELIKVLPNYQPSPAQIQITESQFQQMQKCFEDTVNEIRAMEQSQFQQMQTYFEDTVNEIRAMEQSQFQQTQSELARSQSQFQQMQKYFEDAVNEIRAMEKLQFQQTQSELARSQSQFQHMQKCFEDAISAIKTGEQSQLVQAQSELAQLQCQLQQTQFELERAQFQARQNQNEVESMKTSKFWKLRTIWFKIKPRLKFFLNFFKVNVDDIDGGNLLAIAQAAVDDSSILGETVTPAKILDYKEGIRRIYATYLQSFIISKATLKLPTHPKPLVSIVLVLYNRAELTLQCLLSLVANCNEPYEIIIVDNASSDATHELLKQLEGVRVIYNHENKHFLLASNQAAKEAKGEYILFLNNDAQILPGSVTSALETISESDDIGAVGGKIILLDGSLQEAGSIIWNDGSCLGYGRGDSPLAPMYMFKRDVDYCSGAFLLTKRHLFIDNGGFDEDFQPAYYEETDYCLRLWQMQQRVVYDPNAVILHYEFASSKSVDSALSLQSKHRDIFVNKHQQKLRDHQIPDLANILLARDAHKYCGRVLFIDDRVPHSFLGSGFPRSREILYSLLELNYFVSFFPLSFCEEDWKTVYQDIPNDIEIILNYGLENFERFLSERKDYYDVVFISRPHNFKLLRPIIERKQELFPNIKFIYDAEALFSLRNISKSNLSGNLISKNDAEDMIAKELSLPKCADRIVSVSEQEGQKFSDYGYKEVFTLGHSLTLAPTQKSFENRSDILFVGAIYEDDSPNADSIFWFVKDILPLIREQLNLDLKLNIVGPITSELILNLRSDYIKIWGQVDDLANLFDCAKIFIAPTRFAAGIPMKVHTSAGYGLPIVTTSLIAAQVNWNNNVDLLTADDCVEFAQQCVRLYTDPQLWQTLRTNALNKISEECSPAAFTNNLKNLLTF